MTSLNLDGHNRRIIIIIIIIIINPDFKEPSSNQTPLKTLYNDERKRKRNQRKIYMYVKMI